MGGNQMYLFLVDRLLVLLGQSGIQYVLRNGVWEEELLVLSFYTRVTVSLHENTLILNCKFQTWHVCGFHFLCENVCLAERDLLRGRYLA